MKLHFKVCQLAMEHPVGVLDLKIIANDTILLIISISTTFALSVTIRVSNEAKFFQEVKFLGFMRCFSVKIEKSSKMSKIQPKTCKKYHIFEDFLILTEKQSTKPKNLISWKDFASFDTLLVPWSAKFNKD